MQPITAFASAGFLWMVVEELAQLGEELDVSVGVVVPVAAAAVPVPVAAAVVPVPVAAAVVPVPVEEEPEELVPFRLETDIEEVSNCEFKLEELKR